MSKESTQKRIMAAIELRGDGIRILNRDGDRINHVLVHCFGEVWPTTGTAKLNSGEWIRKNPDKLIGKLRKSQGKAKAGTEKTDKEKISRLEEQVRELFKIVEEMEEAIKI